MFNLAVIKAIIMEQNFFLKLFTVVYSKKYLNECSLNFPYNAVCKNALFGCFFAFH